MAKYRHFSRPNFWSTRVTQSAAREATYIESRFYYKSNPFLLVVNQIYTKKLFPKYFQAQWLSIQNNAKHVYNPNTY